MAAMRNDLVKLLQSLGHDEKTTLGDIIAGGPSTPDDDRKTEDCEACSTDHAVEHWRDNGRPLLSEGYSTIYSGGPIPGPSALSRVASAIGLTTPSSRSQSQPPGGPRA